MENVNIERQNGFFNKWKLSFQVAILFHGLIKAWCFCPLNFPFYLIPREALFSMYFVFTRRSKGLNHLMDLSLLCTSVAFGRRFSRKEWKRAFRYCSLFLCLVRTLLKCRAGKWNFSFLFCWYGFLSLLMQWKTGHGKEDSWRRVERIHSMSELPLLLWSLPCPALSSASPVSLIVMSLVLASISFNARLAGIGFSLSKQMGSWCRMGFTGWMLGDWGSFFFFWIKF